MISPEHTLLAVAPDASPAQIEAAYQRKVLEYEIDAAAPADLRALADERLAALKAARAALLASSTAGPRSLLSTREWLGIGAGVLVAVLIIGFIALSKRNTPQLNAWVMLDRAAPDLTLSTLDGGTMRLADLRGKVVLVNFWATWCEPCKIETPDLVAASQAFKDRGLEIIGINLTNQDSLDEIRRFVQRYQVTYPIALDRDQAAQRAFGIYPIPVSYFIDSTGRIRYTRTSIVTRTDIERILEELTP